MQNLKQGGIHDHGLRLSHQLGHDGASQRFEISPEFAYPPVERGGMEADDLGEEVAEKAGDLAQEGALGLHAPKLLEDGEGDHFGIREPLEGSVEIRLRVEDSITVVDLAEQSDDRFFQELG
jgi:hypothetical protein